MVRIYSNHITCCIFKFQNVCNVPTDKMYCCSQKSDAVDFHVKSLGMKYSVITASEGCSIERVKHTVPSLYEWLSFLCVICYRGKCKNITKTCLYITLCQQSHPYTFKWMQGAWNNKTMKQESFCVRTIANYSTARSPAFDMEGEARPVENTLKNLPVYSV